jgi:soluble lytic murein transglycosylase
MRRLWLFPVCLFLSGTGLAQPDPDPADTVRAEFLAAYERARAGLPDTVPDSQRLRDYSIYPYVVAARLGRDLNLPQPDLSDTDDAVAAFLSDHDGQPVSMNLRVAWLRSLGSRELWREFLRHYRADVADTGLRCRYLAARIAVDDRQGIAPLILDEWLSPYQLPLECEPVFQWLRDAGPLDDDMTEARVRLLLENGQAAFARVIARRLPEARARPLLAWANLIERPLSTIESYIEGVAGDLGDAMLLDGWSRLARDNPTAADRLHDLLITTEGFDPAGAGPFTRALALGLAWDRRPEALEYFARVPASWMDDYTLAWQARAALWAGDMDLARRSIAAMSVEQRSSAQWRYWAARVSEDRDERERLYRSILPNDNYFAAAAAANLRRRAEPHPVRHEIDNATVSRLGSEPAITRAVELWRLGLPVAATREWRHAYSSFDAEERAQSIHLAMTIGWFDLAVATATEHDVFFDYELLYPTPFTEAVESAAREFGLERSLLYAVIRQESLYRVDAVSSAGATGLMQLRPGTARDVARDLGADAPSRVDLLDPTVNVRLGAARLAALLERFDDGIVPALAAYNAGPAAADRWLPPEPLDGDIWLENVPYNETREYVRRVLWHTVVFESLAGSRLNPGHWLQEVEPRTEDR